LLSFSREQSLGHFYELKENEMEALECCCRRRWVDANAIVDPLSLGMLSNLGRPESHRHLELHPECFL
jgi:hypothetical protein